MRTLQDQLIEKGFSRRVGREIDRKSTKFRGKREERLTNRELADLMGTNRPRYARKRGGAFTQR